MPNYEIVHRFCALKKKEARCPAIFDSDSSKPGDFGKHVNDCLAKDTKCTKLQCKYAGGHKEPFSE